MTARLSHITVVLLATIGLLGTVLRADLISIDFNRRNAPTPSATASATVIDANGDASLPGQTVYWNQLLMGVADVPETLNQPSVSNMTMINSLKNGNGILADVSFTPNITLACCYVKD